MTNSSKRNNINIIDFLFSGIPGNTSSNIDKDEIYSIISSDKTIFIKVIPYIIIFWTLIFAIQLALHIIIGSSDCIGNSGPTTPSFFFDGDSQPLIAATSRFMKITIGFIIVSELLLLFFLVGRSIL